MKIGDVRKCDVCCATIPQNQIYKVAIVDRAALKLFLELPDAELQPTWTELSDGSGKICMEICMMCHAQMRGMVC